MNKSWNKFMLALVAVVILFSFALRMSKAQDNQATVCRDVGYGGNSYVITIPDEWNNPDIASWWVLADGFGRWSDDPEFKNVYRADGLTVVDLYGEGYPDWYKDIEVGNVLVGSGDYSVIVVGDENTQPCDAAPPASVVLSCPATAIDSRTGKEYCYNPIASGVIPLPPAP